MAFTIYDASIPVFTRLLKALAANLDKAAAHAADHKIKPEALITARLYPDMFTLAEQVRAACNHAVRGAARLTGATAPDFAGTDASFADLKARIDWALGFLAGLPAEGFAGAESREVVLPAAGGERRLSGGDYLLALAMPNFMFHATTAYDILRHNGVPLHKADFLGLG
jgi:hypothetical protein